MTDPKDPTPLDLAQFDGHTEGPWVAEIHDGRWSAWHSEGMACVADAHGGVEPDPSGAANARLLAAAPTLLAEVRALRGLQPKLLAACEALLRCMTHPSGDDSDVDRAVRLAIEAVLAVKGRVTKAGEP